MKKITTILLICLLLVACIGSANATGNITGKMFNGDGTVCWQTRTNLSSSEVTTQMSEGGYLYNMDGKSVALVSPAASCTVDRVRVHPYYMYSYVGGDLRIDPNYSSNTVGLGQYNGTKQVYGVQSLLYDLGYQLNSDGTIMGIDGGVGNYTDAAIKAFQRSHNLGRDGIVGANTWRALCSSSTFMYGSSTW